ncbi:MAG: hypothetical protein KKB50_16945 [Planctomycetes bacterium]|nr:hypothetical protein [Planctomycetota bacterium]
MPEFDEPAQPVHPPRVDTSPEEITDPAQESLVSALRSSFNILRVIMVFLVVAYFLSGMFRIQPGEQGLIVRLGTLLINRDDQSPHNETPIFDPGLIWWALPDPFDERIRLSGQAHDLTINTFLFSQGAANPDKPLSEIDASRGALKPGVDGAMITGDRNLAHGRWTVTYRIADGDRFVLNVAEKPETLEPLLQRLTETAVLRAVSHRRIEEVTQTAINEITQEVARSLRAELEELQTGITIDKVLAETIEPAGVRDAFLRATAAQNERKSEVERAKQRRSEILNRAAGPNHEHLLAAIQAYGAAQVAGAEPERLNELRKAIDAELERAEGQVAVILREAQAAASEIRERVRGEVEEFKYYLESYDKYPRLTLWRRWVEMRTTILASKLNEVFFVPSFADEIEILTNRDMQKLIEAERERYRQQRYGPRE